MESQRWIVRLCKWWLVTAIITALIILIQNILPSIFQKDKYMHMIMDYNGTVKMLVICIIFLCILSGVILASKSRELQQYTKEISQSKTIKYIVTSVSILTCLIIVLAGSGKVLSDVIKAKNVQELDGTVENVIGISDENSGRVSKVVTIKDTEGKKYKLHKSNKLNSLEVGKKDKIHVDYLKAPSNGSNVLDGDILGYVSNTPKLDKKKLE